MNKGTAFGTAFGLALLAALLAGGYLLIEYVGGVFTALEPQARTLTAIGSVVVLLSALIVAEGLRARRPQDGPLHAQKAALYQQLLSVCCERWQRSGAAREASDLSEIERSLSLQGSSGVIAAYLELKRASSDDAAPEATQADLLKRLVAEMRRDLGSRDLITKEREILELLTGIAGEAETVRRAVHE